MADALRPDAAWLNITQLCVGEGNVAYPELSHGLPIGASTSLLRTCTWLRPVCLCTCHRPSVFVSLLFLWRLGLAAFGERVSFQK